MMFLLAFLLLLSELRRPPADGLTLVATLTTDDQDEVIRDTVEWEKRHLSQRDGSESESDDSN